MQGFCVLYIVLSEFLIKGVLECKVSSTYLIECCDCTPFNLILKITILLTFNTTHKMECYEYWYSLGWYNLWCVKLRSLNYPFHGRNYIIQLFFLKRDKTIITFSFALFYFILSFVFDIYILWLSSSNKIWLCKLFSLLQRHELLLHEHFNSILTFLYFYKITNFDSHYCNYYHYCHYCYYFIIAIAIIISSFSILLTFIILVFTILFYIFV